MNLSYRRPKIHDEKTQRELSHGGLSGLRSHDARAA
jgi:hypothetical protein